MRMPRLSRRSIAAGYREKFGSEMNLTRRGGPGRRRWLVGLPGGGYELCETLWDVVDLINDTPCGNP